MASPRHEERLKETRVSWLGAYDQYSEVISLWISNISEHENVIKLTVNEWYFVYVCILCEESVWCRTIPVHCSGMLKVDIKKKKSKKVRKEGSWKLTTTWFEIVAVLIVFPEIQRRLKLCEVENIVTWQLLLCFSPPLPNNVCRV